MSIQNHEAFERFQAVSGQVRAAVIAAVHDVKAVWRTRGFPPSAYGETANIALSLELLLERLRGAEDDIRVALEGRLPDDFLARVQRVERAAAAMPNAMRGLPNPRAILRRTRALVQLYADLAPPESTERLADDAAFPVFAAAASAPSPTGQVAAGTQQVRLFDALGSSALAPVPQPITAWNALRSGRPGIASSLEPRLQVTLARHDSGAGRVAWASIAEDEVAVIAEVDDVARWEALSEVRVGTQLAPGPDDAQAWIVTGRIPIARVDHVRRQPFVRSLAATRPVGPALESTLNDLGLGATPPITGLHHGGGAGVVVGVVDFGCDFVHRNFRHADGSTRIEALWVQAASAVPGGAPLYGRLYTRADIDAALGQPNPYQALGYRPPPGAHGTHVMDIAAGNGRGSGVAGCAPESTIVFVDLSPTDVSWEGPAGVGQSFGDSVRVLEAVDFIFAQAGARPCVVNLSLGTNGGPHDGTTPVEQGFDRLLVARDNRAIVLAAGNAQTDGIHHNGILPGSGSIDLVWKIKPGPAGQEMEIWTAAGARVAVEVIAPDGTPLGVTEPDDNSSVGTDAEVVLYVANQLHAANGDNVIGIYLAGSVGKGDFIVRLLNRDGDDTTYHAWIERADGAQSSFAAPVDSHTLGSISCGNQTICVGSYDAHKRSRILSFFSSNGPTRDGRLKPEVSAPGHQVVAADARSTTDVTTMSGTSMAAPAVSGLTALLFAEAMNKGKSLSSSQLRTALFTGVSPQTGIAPGGWDPGFGHGPVNAAALLLV